MQEESNKKSSQNGNLKRRIFGERIATQPPVSSDPFKNVESMMHSKVCFLLFFFVHFHHF
uniref:Uncharacterized protein n=1 Tax=Ascaris lumbricoides TaxID=6252 RepID=A0A0M3HLB8_ASCLU